MQRDISGSSIFNVSDDSCSCYADSSSGAESALGDVFGSPGESEYDPYNDAGVDPGTIAYPITHTQSLEGVRVDDSCNLSVDLMIVLTLLIILATISFVVFAVLTNEGIIHIPGITPEVMTSANNCIGIVLGVSFSYMFLVNGLELIL